VSEQERNQILKAGLFLMLLEGWTPAGTVARKFGWSDIAPLSWLCGNGFAQQGAGGVVRWNTPVEFEQLWGQLIPDRPCPMRLRLGSEVTHRG